MVGGSHRPHGDPGQRVCTGHFAHDLDQLELRVYTIPSLLVVTAGALSFGVSVAEFAFGHLRLGVDAASTGLLVIGAGLSWLAMERRRVRQAERDWRRSSPDAARGGVAPSSFTEVSTVSTVSTPDRSLAPRTPGR